MHLIYAIDFWPRRLKLLGIGDGGGLLILVGFSAFYSPEDDGSEDGKNCNNPSSSA